METTILLEFNNKKYIKKIKTISSIINNNDKINNDKINNDNNKIIIKDFIKKTIDDISYKNFENNINEYFILKNGLLVLPSNILLNPCNSINNIAYKNVNISCYRKMKGGDFMDLVLSPLELFFKPIFDPIKAIINVFIMIGKLIEWLIEFIIWFIQFMIWIFTDLLNPVNFCNDFFNSIMMIIIAIFSTLFNIIKACVAITVNTIGNWMQGFWGWDQSGLTKSDKESNYFKSINRKKGSKYYLTNSNTVPFSVILGTILCPPMGVFMDMGLTGWLNIVVCCLLTLLFYIPGLLYALLIIYS